MKLNIERFDTTYTQYYPSYEPTYTPKGYLRSNKVTIECDYDVTQVLLCLGQALDDNLVDVTSEWIIEDNVISKNFTEPQNNEQYVVNFENSQYGMYGYFILNIADDFTPDSERFPVEINGDIRISNSEIKLKKVAETIKDLTDIIYPIGSIYKSTSAINPQNIFGGTWTQITDDTIVAYAEMSGTTLNQSKNISSITGSSTFTVTFSKAMADAKYKAFVSGECSGLGAEIIGVHGKTTTGFKFDFCNYSGATTTPTSQNILVIGRLANPEYYEWKRTA